jgi:hypothetical protein
VITEFLNEDIAMKEQNFEKRSQIQSPKSAQASTNRVRIRPHNDGITKNLPKNIEERLTDEIFSARQQKTERLHI